MRGATWALAWAVLSVVCLLACAEPVSVCVFFFRHMFVVACVFVRLCAHVYMRVCLCLYSDVLWVMRRLRLGKNGVRFFLLLILRVRRIGETAPREVPRHPVCRARCLYVLGM